MSSSWGNQPRYGEFEILGAREGRPCLLGEGSFGKTYEAVRTDSVAGHVLKEDFALKVLNPSLLASESKRLQFIQELQALTKFKHPNLIHYIRAGEQSGECYYAMELCSGRDLSKLVERCGMLPERLAALIALQVATGLKEIHQRHGLVHRDIKPSNIMLINELAEGLSSDEITALFEEDESLCRIVDFGLVDFRSAEDEASGGFNRDSFKGSPMYASPEQVFRQPIDGRSDIYSLGMTVWFLVQGRGPLLGPKGQEVRDVKDALRRHTSPDEHAPSLPPHLSEAFRQILCKMIAKRPEQRFQSASELQLALRKYLIENPVVVRRASSMLKLQGPLDLEYSLEAGFPSRVGRKCYKALQKSTGQVFKLTVVEDLEGDHDASRLEEIIKHLCELAEIAALPDAPATIITVKGVIKASDVLVYVEELPVRHTLAGLLRVKRKIGFDEACSLLRPIAEALDFLLLHGRDKVNLVSEEVWLTSDQVEMGPAGDTTALLLPVNEWRNPRVRFSIMSIPAAVMDSNNSMVGATQTISGGLYLADTASHPVTAFCRLLYRVLTGSEVARDAEFNPRAYINSVSLGAASNFLIRDILCQHKTRASVVELLNDICVFEGVIKPPITSQQSQSSRETFSTAVRTGTSTTAGATVTGEPESIGEVVRPGIVISPYDGERHEIVVPADQWEPQARIACPHTRRVFKLPRKLDPLFAEPVNVGVVHSPYADAGVNQQVSWDDWVPGGKIICSYTGKALKLPPDLPLPVGVLPPFGIGKVLSPYSPATQISVNPELWEPKGVVICPATGKPFQLPADLPVLEAFADPLKPGILSTPFNPAVQWVIDPPQWEAGGSVICPATGKPLKLPPIVDRWWPETTVVDVRARLVENPFRPGTTIEVPAQSWKPGGVVNSPEARGAVMLPKNLPPLIGEVPTGLRPGVIRSPYSGVEVTVGADKWRPRGLVSCPKTRMVFELPVDLPKWVELGKVSAEEPGIVTSPYAPFPSVPVPAAEWESGREIVCPASGRKFVLPDKLPPLEAVVSKGQLGTAASPFAPDAKMELKLDEWKSGYPLVCRKTGKTFVLPKSLEEWIVDAAWIPRSPGSVRSPFGDHPSVVLSAEQWRPGTLVECPVAARRFRVPVLDGFPSLRAEKEIVSLALAHPSESNEKIAEDAKGIDSSLSAEAIGALLARHELDTVAKREAAQETGGVLPDEPGFVLSPYGRKPKLPVPPGKWGNARASLVCPETNRSFILPSDLPPLMAVPVESSPGTVISPFDDSKPFELDPNDWKPGGIIKCKNSGKPLMLPKKLPEWIPTGIVSDGEPGVVISPFGRKAKMDVRASDWEPGRILVCKETGNRFRLPDTLPPLAALDVRSGSIDSPYAPGHRFALKPDQWLENGIVECPETGRKIRLPSTLPKTDWEGEVVPGRPAVLRSPFGSRRDVRVDGPDWRAGADIVCPETGRIFKAPVSLPPLRAEYAGKLGEVRSPYRPGSVIAVPIADWEPDHALTCPSSGIVCLLPGKLPEWEGEGLLTEKPGFVESPYRKGQHISVPPLEWLPKAKIRCPASDRNFYLPDKLPLLEGRVIDGGRGLVASPFDEGGAPQTVPPGGWIPGNHVECEKTGREFLLPKALEELALPGILVPGKPGFLVSPYGRRRELPVAGADWYSGAKIICPETGNKITLPKDLPPMEATVAGPELGKVESPYAKGQIVSIAHKNWMPGARGICPATKRAFVLPMTLPVWEKKPFPVKPALLVASAFVLIVVLGFGIKAMIPSHSGQGDKGDSADGGRVQEDSHRQNVQSPHVDPTPPKDELAALIKRAEKEGKALDTSFSSSAAEEYCLLITSILNSPQLDPKLRPKYSEDLALRRKDILIHESPLDRELFSSEQHDLARLYFAAKVDGNTELIRERFKAMKERGNKLDRYIVAKTTYDDAGKDTIRALPELQAAAESGIKWAQQILKTSLIAKKDPNRKLTVIDPLGEQPEGILVDRQSWNKGASCETKAPPRWFKLPEDIEPLPAPQILFGAKVTAEGAESLNLLKVGLSFSIKGRSCALEASAGGSLRIPVPEGMESEASIEGVMSLAGWESKQVKASQNPSGDFIVSQPIKLQRRTAVLPVTLGKEGCDYDFIKATWVAPLGSEKAAVPLLDPEPIKISSEGLATRLPSGIYSLELRGSDPSIVHPFLWKKQLEVGKEDSAADLARLPASMRGDYFCMPSTVGNEKGVFAALQIGPKLKSVTIIGVKRNLTEVVSFKDVVGSSGRRDNEFGPVENLVLQDPWTIEFECLGPVITYFQKWRLQAQDDDTKWMYVLLPPDGDRKAYETIARNAAESLCRVVQPSDTHVGTITALNQAIKKELKYSSGGATIDLFEYYLKSTTEARKNGEHLKERYPELRDSTDAVVYYVQAFPSGKRFKPSQNGGDWDLKEVAP